MKIITAFLLATLLFPATAFAQGDQTLQNSAGDTFVATESSKESMKGPTDVVAPAARAEVLASRATREDLPETTGIAPDVGGGDVEPDLRSLQKQITSLQNVVNKQTVVIKRLDNDIAEIHRELLKGKTE